MKTLSQRDFKGVPKEYKWIVVNKDSIAWAFTQQPVYQKSTGRWVAKETDASVAIHLVGEGYLFGQVAERKEGWLRRIIVGWLVEAPQFNNADRYRFARDCLFDNQLWEVWSAIRFADRYDFNAERYDECVDKAIAECIDKGIWK